MRNHESHHHSSSDTSTHAEDTHGHTHGAIDPALFTTQRGMWAVKWSFLGLAATALFQVLIVWLTGSVALLADTIHNLGDALTAIPLWIAFRLSQWKPNRRFTYGYGRVEDLAGVTIVGTILISALISGYLSVERLFHPQPVSYIGAVIAAALIGFVGNEVVAIFRLRVGKEIGSTALIADGYHARADGWASLSVVFGAVGVWLGYALADPIVGLVITVVILRIVWQSGKAVFTRLLDGIDPEVIDEITRAVHHTQGVCDISEVRIRWLGHRLHAEVNVAVLADLSVEQGHDIAKAVRHNLLHELRYLSNATIHIDPITASGEVHHAIANHTHDERPPHSH